MMDFPDLINGTFTTGDESAAASHFPTTGEFIGKFPATHSYLPRVSREFGSKSVGIIFGDADFDNTMQGIRREGSACAMEFCGTATVIMKLWQRGVSINQRSIRCCQ